MPASPQLPFWFPFADPGNTEVDLDEWKTYAVERLNRFAQKQKWMLQDKGWQESGELDPESKEEIGGHILLRLAASQDPRAESWMVEEEGDLFEYRFGLSSLVEKLAVTRFLFGTDNVRTRIELEERWTEEQKHEMIRRLSSLVLSSRRRRHRASTIGGGNQEIIGVYFTQIPRLIANRSVLLLDGWGIAPFRVFIGELKKRFESKLREEIRKSFKLAKSMPQVESVAKEIARVSKDLARTRGGGLSSSNISLGGRKIDETLDNFPPCIRSLMHILMSKGHLAHMLRIQLGLFLKKIGMSPEDQMRFWYNNAVDNVGVPFEVFEKKVGYQIRHLYGLEGGRKDYEPPKCSTCIDGYYCYFAHVDWPVIEEDINSNLKTFLELPRGQESYQRIVDASSRGDPQAACAGFLELTSGAKLKRVFTMTQYMREALKALDAKKSADTKAKMSEDKHKTKGNSNASSDMTSANPPGDILDELLDTDEFIEIDPLDEEASTSGTSAPQRSETDNTGKDPEA